MTSGVPSLPHPARYLTHLKPNTPTICTTIHEVAEDAKYFRVVATDLEGYETNWILLLKRGNRFSSANFSASWDV